MLGLTLGLVACSDKSSNEPAVQPSGEVVEFSTELAIEAPELVSFDQEGARAFDYKMEANGSKGYPKPKVQFTEGQQVPVLCVIRNTAPFSQANPVIIQKLNFTFKNGKLRAEELPVSLPGGARLDVNRDGWHILCIVGADDFDPGTGTASFSSETALPANAVVGDTRQLKTLYMNKEKWAKLEVIPNSQGKLGFRGAEDIHLVSQGTVLMVRALNLTTRDKLLRGFQVESNTLAFAGQIEGLATTTVAAGLPKFKAATTTGAADIRLANPETVAANTVTPGVYIIYGIPDRLNTNKTAINAQTGLTFQKTKTYQYLNSFKPNTFYNLSAIQLTKEPITHPIEAMLFNEDTEATFIGESGTFAETLARVDEGEFSLPSADRARALFPGTLNPRGILKNIGQDAYGYVNLGDGREHLGIAEQIEAFGVTDIYTGDYINPASSPNVSYAIRFKGGSNNEYLSAYRYEKTANGVKITVRVLGPTRVTTSLSQVANETYWNTAPEFGQKEIVRELPKGKFWTSTTFMDGNTEYAHLIRIFEWDGAPLLSETKNSLYVSNYRAQTDRTKVERNKSHYMSFTSEKN